MVFLASPASAGLLFALASIGMSAVMGVAAVAAPVKTGHVTAELVSEQAAVSPGQTVRIGLKLQHIPHWHTYWRNPGDSGLPTTLSWTLPAGSQASDIQWPAPQRLPIGPLVNYGYEGELLLPVAYTAPADAKAGDSLALRAKAQWLVCNEVCIPEQAMLDLNLPVAAPGVLPAKTDHAQRVTAAEARQAVPLSAWSVKAERADRELILLMTKAEGAQASPVSPVSTIEVFPYAEQLLEPSRHEVYRTPTGYAVKLKLSDDAAPPASLEGIVVARGGASPWPGGRESVEFHVPVSTVAALALPVGAERVSASSAGESGEVGIADGIGFWAALLAAFAGGLVLNLMPCVFPVLSIKLLGLAQQREKGPQARVALRAHAMAYSTGVILSFLALAGGLLALRAAGSAVGWGFQLQEPSVVFVLGLLFFALGLNLMGAFEFANFMPQRLSGWRAQRPFVDALASGVLAVVAASPCTAPFMGAALGFAITQPPLAALAVFLALGIGMALPYALLVVMPGWRSRLPRPGAWMLRLKQALAFPMFATVVWLVWVLGIQAGMDAAAKALLALVGLAFSLWLAGASANRQQWVRLIPIGVLVGTVLWAWPMSGPGSASAAASAEAHDAWSPYDEAAVARHVADGRPVFVDFTAAWCVSCQVNKRLVLHTDATMQAFAQSKVALMRADWTNRDVKITEALARLGRNGVPVYVLIRPGREPLLLPEILTGRVVRDALATL